MDSVTPAKESSRPQSVLEWGIAERALPGEAVNGDRYVMHPFPDGVLIAVVDGLGHGAEAAMAAEIATATLQAYCQEPVTFLLERCHSALKRTRGAAISIASVSAKHGLIAWAGVGNVEGVILRVDEKAVSAQEHIPLFAGVAGYRLPAVRPMVTPINRGDLIIFYTDGIRADIPFHPMSGRSTELIAQRICDKYCKGTDDALVLVARYAGPANSEDGSNSR
jgi:serine phosphatase RsbU (regulator of sigma subunit)